MVMYMKKLVVPIDVCILSFIFMPGLLNENGYISSNRYGCWMVHQSPKGQVLESWAAVGIQALLRQTPTAEQIQERGTQTARLRQDYEPLLCLIF